MGQPGFFDVEERYDALDAMGDPLVVLKNSVRGRNFVRYAPRSMRKSVNRLPVASLWTR